MTAVCPTTAVRDQVARRFPQLATQVRVFTVADGLRLSQGERHGGRAAFSIPEAEAAVSMVGGWWPHKDIAVIGRALARLTEPLHVSVTSHPVHDTVLARWQALPHVRLHVEPGR
ncbi:hypothetical protein AB0O01_21130 [Streptomyces sp. NPDC093252]|uniref:hypothetical protein n=1 Tax=Streptomyces sp. NPDC093252 TaxID=3154980 RepID=UPI00343EF20C